MASVELNFLDLVKNATKNYESTTASKVETDIEQFRRSNFRLKFLYKYALKRADDLDAVKSLIPEPKMGA